MYKSTKRAIRRKNDYSKALRKQSISQEIYHHDWYDNLHEYSKNKVHCSCPMCSGMAKTNQKKFRGKGKRYKKYGVCGWGTTNKRHGKNWAMPELKKIQSMQDKLNEYYIGA